VKGRVRKGWRREGGERGREEKGKRKWTGEGVTGYERTRREKGKR